MAFMDKRMRIIREQDKEIVLERIRTEGWPQHLGMSRNDLPPHILGMYIAMIRPQVPRPQDTSLAKRC